jgi:hypothetical protein
MARFSRHEIDASIVLRSIPEELPLKDDDAA